MDRILDCGLGRNDGLGLAGVLLIGAVWAIILLLPPAVLRRFICVEKSPELKL